MLELINNNPVLATLVFELIVAIVVAVATKTDKSDKIVSVLQKILNYFKSK